MSTTGTLRALRKAAAVAVSGCAALALVAVPAATPALSALGDVVPKTAADDNSWLSFSSGVTPGGAIRIGSTDTTAKATRCTSGFATTSPTSKYTVVTAGHCFRNYGPHSFYAVAGEADYRRLGEVTVFQDRDNTGKVVDFESDFAIIPVTSGIGNHGTAWVADQYKVSRLYDRDDLHVGMKLCKYGYRTEETCGTITDVNDEFVRASVFSLSGDSGSPAYTKLSDGTVAAVGVLSGSPRDSDGNVDDYVTDFALLAPILDTQGLELA